MKASYTSVDPDGRYQFHRPDGTEVVVGSQPFVTDDQALIVLLDESPFVRRATKAKSEEA